MMQRMLQRGFTLIELLVVIAIIGILAAVILTSLGGAQEGAQNSNIKQTLGSAANAAQIHYNANNFTYTDLCTTDLNEDGGTLADLQSAVGFITDTQSNDTAGNTEIACYDSANAWAISAPLIDGANVGDVFWCIDSTGFRGEISDHTTNTSCN